MSKARYCSIAKYLEKKHKKLYDLLENELCLASELRVKRNLSGSTFIIPTSKQVDDLVKKVNSGNYDDPVDELLCHVLRDYLPTPAAFNAHKDDVPNGHGQKAEIVAGNKVTVNGAEIELVKEFQAMSKGPNGKTKLVVYQAKGPMKVSSKAPKATFKNTRIEYNKDGGIKNKKGGGWHQTSGEVDLESLRRNVEANYYRSILSPRDGKEQMCNNYMEVLASYLTFCQYDKECSQHYLTELSHCDPGAHCSFYVLFGTRKMKGKANPTCLKRWNDAGCPKVNESTKTYLDHVNGISNAKDGKYGGQLMDRDLNATLANAYRLIQEQYEENAGCSIGRDELRGIVQESFYALENDILACRADVDRVLYDVHSVADGGSFLNPAHNFTGILRAGVKNFIDTPWCCYNQEFARGSGAWNARVHYALAKYSERSVNYKWVAGLVRLLKQSGDKDTLTAITNACNEPVSQPDVSGGAKHKKGKKGKKKGGTDADGFLGESGAEDDAADNFLDAPGADGEYVDGADEGFLSTGTSFNNGNNDGLEGDSGVTGSLTAADTSLNDADAVDADAGDLDMASGGFEL